MVRSCQCPERRNDFLERLDRSSEGHAPSSSSGKAHVGIASCRLRRRNRDRVPALLPRRRIANPFVQTNLAVVVQLHRGLRRLRAHEKNKVYRAKPVPTDNCSQSRESPRVLIAP